MISKQWKKEAAESPLEKRADLGHGASALREAKGA